MQLLDDENRDIKRTVISLPVNVEVKDRHGALWSDFGWFQDVSNVGAGFSLPRQIQRGRLVLLKSRLPKEFRSFDFNKAEYNVWGLVRRCIEAQDATGGTFFSIGVAFVGKNPPSKYVRDPSAVFELAGSSPSQDGFWELLDTDMSGEPDTQPVEKRRHTRLQMAETVMLQLMDAGGKLAPPETTITENVSQYGAAVFSQLHAAVGSFLRVTLVRDNTTLIAIVRDKHIGADAMPRLHIEFIDKLFPLEGIE
jgi:hypothetical protein